MRGKTVLLIIGGGIAAYKSLELIRRLKERGTSVRAILTKAGAEFVTPLSVAALAGERVFQDLFSLTDEAEMGHIQLSRWADLVVVAPATADLMAKLAGGLANDLASTALLATDKRVLMAPAMNVRMWNHAATQRNVAALKADGVLFVGPNDGEMACGEYGPGRMSEPTEIANAIEAALESSADGPLAGFKALVTAGPTQEPLDPVRFISNRRGFGRRRRRGDARVRSCKACGTFARQTAQGYDRNRDAERVRVVAACRCGGVRRRCCRLASHRACQQQDQEDRRRRGAVRAAYAEP
jgi:phosphopantothenoylcysteine decarboxylase/phosphopantothenate--cysteine ligase